MMPESFAKVADNAHLFDPDSLELILYEGSRAYEQGDHCLDIGAMRWKETPEVLRRLVLSHVRAGRGTIVELGPLEAET
jgi:hypothetical protein